MEMEDIEKFIDETTTKDETVEKINFFRLERKCMTPAIPSPLSPSPTLLPLLFLLSLFIYLLFLVFKCSSKTGEGISEVLEYVAKTIAQDER